jgi:hypothetical protein
MTGQSFSLTPFPVPNAPEITITGNISRQDNLLAWHYAVTGNTGDILLPSPSVHPSRKDELWKATCFEFFLAIKGQPQYWEFNMSSSGDWNVYCMDAYRRVGFREETLMQRLPFDVQNDAGVLTLNAAADLSPLVHQSQSLEIGITAVVKMKDGNETYWALAHPASYADFHSRASFILALAGQIHPLPQSAPGS